VLPQVGGDTAALGGRSYFRLTWAALLISQVGEATKYLRWAELLLRQVGGATAEGAAGV